MKLNSESKETKVRKNRWYVAHVLCKTLIYYFFPPKKLRGPEGGSRFCLHPFLGRRHNSRWTHSPQTRSRNEMAVFWCFSLSLVFFSFSLLPRCSLSLPRPKSNFGKILNLIWLIKKIVRLSFELLHNMLSQTHCKTIL